MFPEVYMSDRICPVCGVGVLNKVAHTIVLDDPYGIAKEVKTLEYKCQACGAQGDFFAENDKLIKKEYAGIRALSLPQPWENFARWQKPATSPA